MIVLLLSSAVHANGVSEEVFTEELLIDAVPGRDLVTFKFRITTPYKRHYQVMPLAVTHLSSSVAFTSFQLAFTRGKWQQEVWQAPRQAVRPAGAELQAAFPANLNPLALSQAWGNLTTSLSGLFCASLNFLSKPTAYSRRTFLPSAMDPLTDHEPKVLHATLPKEPTCTENLTPWTRLLPCRSHTGVARLLHPYLIASAVYMSMEVALVKQEAGLQLDLHLTAMLPTSSPGPTPPHDLATLLPAAASTACPLAAASHFHVALPGDTCATYQDVLHLNVGTCLEACPTAAETPATGVAAGPQPRLASFTPGPGMADRLLALLYYFHHIRAGASWQAPSGSVGGWEAGLQLPQDAVAAGEGRRLGAEWVSVSSQGLQGKLVLDLDLGRGAAAGGPAGGRGAEEGWEEQGRQVVCLYQTIPWYIRAWLHTLQLSIDGQDAPLPQHLVLQRVTPARDRQRPLTMELCLALPGAAAQASLAIDYTKSFLTVFEYPPDAHRGFDLPPVLVWRPAADSGRPAAANSRADEATVWKVGSCAGAPLGAAAPLLETLGYPHVEQVYAEGPIIPEVYPDFSMPYNVCCLTSTVLAIYVGATLKLLLERPEARPAVPPRRKRLQQLLKVVGVVAAVGAVMLVVDKGARESALELLGLPVGGLPPE